MIRMFSIVFTFFFVTVHTVVYNSSDICFTTAWHFAIPCSEIKNLNSFSYYNSQYHIFYYYEPHDKKNESWYCGHAVSNDLVIWNHWRVALPRNRPCTDSCYPIKDVAANDVLPFIYTPWRKPHQNTTTGSTLVSMESEWKVHVFNGRDKSSSFCDPKVWRYQNFWYKVLTDSYKGYNRALLYRSSDFHRWKRVAVLAVGDPGSLWERVEFFELNRYFVLLKTVRDMQSDSNGLKTLGRTEYIIGGFDYLTYKFVPNAANFSKLDFGFDLFAAQTTKAADGRRVLMAHMGTSLSTARELHVSGKSLLAVPVPEYRTLRGELLFAGLASPGAIIALADGMVEVVLHAELRSRRSVALHMESSGVRALIMSYDTVAHEIVVRRTGEADGERRAAVRSISARLACRLFVDIGSVEVFCGAGANVFSNRMYPVKLSRLRVPYNSTPFRIRIFKILRTASQLHSKI